MLSRIFVRVQFDNKKYFLSEKKFLLSGDIKLNPDPAKIPNPLTYGRGIMCSSSTYFSIMQIRSVMTSYCLQLKIVKY